MLRVGLPVLVVLGTLALTAPAGMAQDATADTATSSDTATSCPASATTTDPATGGPSCCQSVDPSDPAYNPSPDPSVCCPLLGPGADLNGDGQSDCPEAGGGDTVVNPELPSGGAVGGGGSSGGGSSGGGSTGGGSTGTTSGSTTTSSGTTSSGSGTVSASTRTTETRESSFTPTQGALPPLPDPLPSGQRLDASWTVKVARIARAHDVDWALVLATIRARGYDGPSPVSLDAVRALVRQLARAGAGEQGLVAFARGYFAADLYREIVALTRYNHAVGLRGLAQGLAAVKDRLQERVLASKRLSIYSGGRYDVSSGLVDVRVLTLLLYLSQSHKSIAVSSLITGHSFFVAAEDSSSPRTPSLHAFGRAVDISAVDGVSIMGSQQPGGLTEHVLREIMQLPAELQPSELISLFQLGGASFALEDHADHIHVGF